MDLIFDRLLRKSTQVKPKNYSTTSNRSKKSLFCWLCSVHHCDPQVRSCYWWWIVQWHNNADDKDSDATMIMQLFIKSPVNGWQKFSGKECRGKKPFKNGMKVFVRVAYSSSCTCHVIFLQFSYFYMYIQ